MTNDKKEGDEDNELTFRFDPSKMPQPLTYETRTGQDDAMRTVLNRYDDHPNPSLAKKETDKKQKQEKGTNSPVAVT